MVLHIAVALSLSFASASLPAAGLAKTHAAPERVEPGAAPEDSPSARPRRLPPKAKPNLDRSGKARRGNASYYHRSFAGKKMANGERMNPDSNIAASRSLPLGTKALVTNLENGRSAVVEIKDRGPYIAGRTVDLTPRTAEELGMKKEGVAPVEVAPIEVPQPDGSVLLGDGAALADAGASATLGASAGASRSESPGESLSESRLAGASGSR